MNSRVCIGVLAALLVGCGSDDEVARTPGEESTGDASPMPDEDGAAHGPVKVTSWIVETVEPVASVEIARITAPVLAEARAERLFPDTPDFAGMYIVTTEQPVTESEAFDVAYRLEALPQVREAAPNFAHHEPDLPQEAAAACFRGSDEFPSNLEWSIERINAPAAWALAPPEGGRRKGEGITICHPDSGWAEHVEFDAEAIVKDLAIDLIDGGSGEDPLNYRGHPGHGTATGSVIVSRENADLGGNPGPVTGVAPRARVIPIRTLKSVAMFLDSDVARAVNYARQQSCDVMSMSLGGAGFFGLKKVIRKAVGEDDRIVVAAAGNCVSWVVAPAKYDTTIAAAATNYEDLPWKGSSRGRAVTASAPGEGVWVARRSRDSNDTSKVEPANGTSYAAAAIAGAAANWLAFHGRDRLDAAKGEHSLAALFRYALRESARKPENWDAESYGAGILDLEALLTIDLDGFPKERPRAIDADSALMTLSRSIDRTPRQTRSVLRHLFGEGDAESLARTYGPELERIAATRPLDMREILNLVDQPAEGSVLDQAVASRLSSRMQAAIQR